MSTEELNNLSIDELQTLLLKNCSLLSVIQKEKCLIKCFNYFEPIYKINREESIKQYNLSCECTFLVDGKKCTKMNSSCNYNRLCNKHNKMYIK